MRLWLFANPRDTLQYTTQELLKTLAFCSRELALSSLTREGLAMRLCRILETAMSMGEIHEAGLRVVELIEEN